MDNDTSSPDRGPEPSEQRDPEGDTHADETRTRRTLHGISSRVWEHPADRAALQALRRVPVFDQVLKRLFGVFGEKPVRLAFQANAVQVSPRQFPEIHRIHEAVLETLDADRETPLFISQNPVVNAGAYGMERPFILLNSGLVRLLNEEELRYVLAHEVGHVKSGHVLYRTMMALLIQLAQRGFPIVGLGARAVMPALLEWYRRSELSSDRAGLLGVQDPDVVFGAMLKMAGGGRSEETNLSEFLRQAEDYAESEDVADSVFKILNLLGTTHPFYVLRVAELRKWIEGGEYDRILRGDYTREGESDPAYLDDLAAAAKAYSEDLRDVVDDVAQAARRVRDSIVQGFGEAFEQASDREPRRRRDE